MRFRTICGASWGIQARRPSNLAHTGRGASWRYCHGSAAAHANQYIGARFVRRAR